MGKVVRKGREGRKGRRKMYPAIVLSLWWEIEGWEMGTGEGVVKEEVCELWRLKLNEPRVKVVIGLMSKPVSSIKLSYCTNIWSLRSCMKKD